MTNTSLKTLHRMIRKTVDNGPVRTLDDDASMIIRNTLRVCFAQLDMGDINGAIESFYVGMCNLEHPSKSHM